MTNIQLTFDPGTSLQQMIAFEMAAQAWESHLSDEITVNLQVGLSDALPDNVMGGALPGIESKEKFDKYYKELQEDVTSTADAEATTALSLISHDDKEVNLMTLGAEVQGVKELKITRANAKAVGLYDKSDQHLDAYILVNNLDNTTGRDWQYDPAQPVSAQQIDFFSVALHEIGHTLGFISGVDDEGWLYELQEAIAKHEEELLKHPDTDKTLEDELKRPKGVLSTLDLFRFSQESANYDADGDGIANPLIDLSVGGEKYFSIDGGVTNLGNFSTGEASELMQSIQIYAEGEVGDGYQASHWQNQAEILGIMDPTIALGERMQISDLDLTALDVIGWDLQASSDDLTNLAAQAKSAIAQQLGQTTAWLDQNPETAAAQLSEDRTKDIEKMIKQSKVYDSLWGGNSLSWLSLEEKIFALMDYIGSFSTLEEGTSVDSTTIDSLWGGSDTTWDSTTIGSLWGGNGTTWSGTTSVDNVDSSDSPVLTEQGIFDLTNEARFGPAGEVVTAQLASAVTSDAGFNNLVGFYTVVDEAGGIDINDDGIADFNPGDNGYTQAALAHAEDPLLTRGQTGSIEFTAGEFVVPFLLADGGDLDEIPAALPEGVQAYFPDLAANADGADHFRVSDKTLGIEDLSGGGDQDFNDFVFQLDFV
jgi:hypothetical protein